VLPWNQAKPADFGTSSAPKESVASIAVEGDYLFAVDVFSAVVTVLTTAAARLSAP
jgi:hypothetical protein